MRDERAARAWLKLTLDRTSDAVLEPEPDYVCPACGGTTLVRVIWQRNENSRGENRPTLANHCCVDAACEWLGKVLPPDDDDRQVARLVRDRWEGEQTR